MNSSTMRSLVAALSLVLVITSCKGRENAASEGGEPTETIAPAAAQPEATGTEAMTQTVNIEDSRTDADGGVLANTPTATVPGGATDTAAATTTTTTGTTTTSTTATTTR